MLSHTIRHTRRSLIAVSSLIIVPGVALAQSGNYCVPGGLACFSVDVTTTSPITGGTDIDLRFRNLQGASASDNSSWSGFWTLQFNAIPGSSFGGMGTITGLTISNVGSASTVQSPGSGYGWTLYQAASYYDYTIIESQPGFSPPIEDLIVGCATTPLDGGTYDIRRTCATSGSPWVSFQFHGSGTWTAGDTDFEVAAVSNDYPGGNLICYVGGAVPTSGVNYPSACESAEAPLESAAPEPATLVLVCTGALGIFGAARTARRRRSAT